MVHLAAPFRPRGAGVIAVGGANVDWSCRAAAPLQLGTSNPGSVQSAFGGVARNVACNLARLGVPVALMSLVGADDIGSRLVADCAAAGVDCSLIVKCAAATGAYVAAINADGELLVGISDMGIIDQLTPDKIAAHESRIANAEMVFGDANLSAASLLALAGLAFRHGVGLTLDPVSTRKAERLRSFLDARLPVFLLTPNREELGIVADRDVATRRGLERAAEQVLERGVACLMVGLGAAGMMVSTPQGHEHIGALSREVRDVTGAGDAAVAAALWALRSGCDLTTAGRAAQIAAATTVATFGPVNPGLGSDALSRALAGEVKGLRR